MTAPHPPRDAGGDGTSAHHRSRDGFSPDALAATVLFALTEAADLGDALRGCCEAIVAQVDAAFARIWTLNESDRVLELQASAGIYTHLDGAHGRVPLGEFKIGRIAASQTPHLSNDVLHDPEVSDPAWAQREAMVSFAGYPLLARGHLVGVVALFARHELAGSTLTALAAIANAIAAAIDRDRSTRDRERLLRQLDDQRRLLEAVLDQMPAGVVIAEAPSGRLVLANRLADAFGHPALNRPTPEALEHEPSVDDDDTLARPLRRALRGEAVLGEQIRQAGAQGDVQLLVSSTPVRDATGVVVAGVSTMVDVTEQSRRAELDRVQFETTRTLAESDSLAEAIPLLLARIAPPLGASVAALWLVDDAGDHLELDAIWHEEGVAFEEFAARSRTITLAADEGLPGGVWQRRAPTWFSDLDQRAPTPRAAVARAAGIHAGFGFPVEVAGNVIGVLELLCGDVRPLDAPLTKVLVGISSQLGQFVERIRAGLALGVSDARRAAMLSSAIDCVIAIDEAGRVTEFNAAAEATFGYTRAEMIGQPMAERLIPEQYRTAHHAGLAQYLDTGVGPVLNQLVELEALRRDGTTFPAEFAIVPIDTPGSIGFSAYLRDITARRHQTRELQTSRAHLAHLAHTLQASLIPPRLPPLPGLDLAAVYRPAGIGDEIGGDFYDVFETATADWAVVIGDVCGKGAEAAAVTALARYTMRATAMRSRRPKSVLVTLNQALHAQHPDRFCTVAYARVRTRDGRVRVTIALGGHPPPLHLDRNGQVHEIGVPGSLLGAYPSVVLHERAVDLLPGETLVFFTDGVTEARNPSGFYGEPRLHDLIRAHAGSGAAELADAIATDVLAFQSGMPRDDIALVVVRR